MTRAHRSAGEYAEDHAAAWPAPAPRPVRGGRRPPAAAASDCEGDFGDLTLNEITSVAAARQVAPSSLLSGQAQAELRETLELVAGLPDPAAALVVGLARLDPATTTVLIEMIDRLA